MVDSAISPDTIKNKPFTKADDIWALGCLAYSFASGYTPYKFNKFSSNEEIFEKIIHEKVPQIPSKWSKAFSDFVSKCFIKYPGDRWTIERLLNHEFMLTARQAEPGWISDYFYWHDNFRSIDSE